MTTPLEACIAAEVLAIAAAKRLRHNEIQTATGINERTWRRYFVEQSRAVPVAVLMDVGDAMGVPAEQIIAAARVRLSEVDPISAELEAGLSPSGRRALKKAREQLEGDDRDPQGPPSRADVDDGAIGRSAIA